MATHNTTGKTQDVDKFIKDAAGLDSKREKEIGQHIGYRYDVNLVPDYSRITPFLTKYIEMMGWDDATLEARLRGLGDLLRELYADGRPPVHAAEELVARRLSGSRDRAR